MNQKEVHFTDVCSERNKDLLAHDSPGPPEAHLGIFQANSFFRLIHVLHPCSLFLCLEATQEVLLGFHGQMGATDRGELGSCCSA